MKYGYIRVSTKGQQRNGNSLPEQRGSILERYTDAKIIEEASSAAEERPIFDALVEKMVEGDLLVVTKLDRFSRSTIEGLQCIDKLMNKGVSVHILNFGLVENTPIGRLILTNFLAYAEFERATIKERTMAGRNQRRKTDPDYKEGRKSVKPENFSKFKKDVDSGLISIKDAIEEMGISRSSWYKFCKETVAV